MMAAVQEIDYRFLKFTRFKELSFWDYYTLANKGSISARFPLVRLGEVLRQRKGSITINNTTVYKRCKVQLYGKGIVLRDEVLGSVIKTKKQQLCKPNDFLVAEIDAKFGGYGIVPADLENAIVSSHYFLFEIDQTKLCPNFLALVIKLQQFSKQVKATGSTNYAAIRPFHVLSYQIPLPPLEEQDELIAAYQSNLTKAKNKESELIGAKQKLESLLCNVLKINVQAVATVQSEGRIKLIQYRNLERWSLNYLLRRDTFSFQETICPVKKLGDVILGMSGGKTPSTHRESYWNGSINWTSPKDFSELMLGQSEDQITEKAIEETGLQVHPAGTILCVFRSGILRHSFPIAITKQPTTINQDVKAIDLDTNIVLPRYFLYYLHGLQRMVIEQASKKSVTVESINVHEFLELPFVLPPTDVQTQIIDLVSTQLEAYKQLLFDAAEQRGSAINEFEKAIFQS